MLRFEQRDKLTELPIDLNRNGREDFVKRLESPYKEFNKNSRRKKIQAAAELTGYNIQYLRRLLRYGKLEGIKIGQI
jgi:hypothetical protein